jgi:4-diphosphocytidyl-2-C-methyl-D-erythritol kinase
MTRRAFAKLNLALVVGPLRVDGKHEVATVLQAIDLHDDVELEPADELAVDGFLDDTLVRAALECIAREAGVEPRWRARIVKRIPVAAGLGGGSSDAAAALELANAVLPEPLEARRLSQLSATIGADVPFFLGNGPALATADGSELTPLDLPQDYVVLLGLPSGEAKASTADVYRRFDERGRADEFGARRAQLVETVSRVEVATDLARLPPNDLTSLPLAYELRGLGAFRADVTGAGPAVYGLFEQLEEAERARAALHGVDASWLARPVPRSR